MKKFLSPSSQVEMTTVKTNTIKVKLEVDMLHERKHRNCRRSDASTEENVAPRLDSANQWPGEPVRFRPPLTPAIRSHGADCLNPSA